MAQRFSKNHIAVEQQPQHMLLGVSDFLREQLGSTVTFKFRTCGTAVGRGAVFGRAVGSQQACSLYAPFNLVLEELCGADAVVVRQLEGAPEPLLAADAYLAYLATLPF